MPKPSLRILRLDQRVHLPSPRGMKDPIIRALLGESIPEDGEEEGDGDGYPAIPAGPERAGETMASRPVEFPAVEPEPGGGVHEVLNVE